MVESSEHRDCVNASLGLPGTWNGLLVRESLVRACVVVETHVLGDDASKMFLAEDEDVIEQLSAERARQALSEASAELRVVVADKHIWRTVHGGVPGLLRAPFVGRRIRDRGVDDLSAAEVEEEEHENLAEPDVVRLDEVTRPCDVVAQERRPALAVASGPGTADVPLDGSLADADAELQQLATDALGAPARVARRHLSDQCRARGGRPSRRPRAPPPEGAESARCQRRMVAGWTSKVASRQAGATRAARAMVNRCQGAHRTRPAIFRCATMSCCRRSAFSAMSSP